MLDVYTAFSKIYTEYYSKKYSEYSVSLVRSDTYDLFGVFPASAIPKFGSDIGLRNLAKAFDICLSDFVPKMEVNVSLKRIYIYVI